MQRLIVSIFVGLGLACTVSGKDDDSGTEPPASSSTADTSAGVGSSSEGGPGGTTEVVDPTSTGATSAGTSAGPTSGPTSAESGEDSSSTAETGPAETGAVEVSFTEVFEQIILPNGCNAGYCHGGGAGGLDMTDEATTYANLVEVAATMPKCDQTMRVVPGSLEASIVWYRVRPAALDMGMPCAPKMPQGSMGLSDEQAQLMSDWIVGGALE